MSYVSVKGLAKSFGHVLAINDVDLDVERGEVMTLLGPSGCGKTTTLRSIAGLERPDRGEIVVAGELVFSSSRKINVPPEKRKVGMVFQSYALFPHMNVFDNIAYPLKIRRYQKSEIKEKVKEVMSYMGLSGLEERYPAQLSGGQQQRVALARAIVYEPSVLLLDEPLSNLDAKLREKMRVDLRRTIKEIGITAIYVTHDQVEAMVISDEIAVMNNGKILQVGTPAEIYSRPKTAFVSDFIGTTNLIRAYVAEVNEERVMLTLKEKGLEGVALVVDRYGEELERGSEVLVSIRPEDITLSQKEEVVKELNVIRGQISSRIYLGNVTEYRVDVNGYELRISAHPSTRLDVGSSVVLGIDPSSCRVIRGAE